MIVKKSSKITPLDRSIYSITIGKLENTNIEPRAIHSFFINFLIITKTTMQHKTPTNMEGIRIVKVLSGNTFKKNQVTSLWRG
jgi:hypothetical protein